MTSYILISKGLVIHRQVKINDKKEQRFGVVPKDLDRNFSVLKKCMNKFDCLVYEMLLIRELTPSLNIQSDSIQAKLFT